MVAADAAAETAGHTARRAISSDLLTAAGDPTIATDFVGYAGMEALVGWDARVAIADEGEDPFVDMSDDDILNAHPGILAAMVAAQANQMRILDSAIVPDGHLVERSSSGELRFNEFDVTTPTTAPERYVTWNEGGVAELVEPSTPYYTGLADRGDTGQSPLAISLDEDVADPFAMSLAYGCVLLQIGVEAGMPVDAFATALSAAWGVPDLFHTGTLAGVEGAQDHSEIFGMDRCANARRLCSWQTASAVRSGQLAMSRADWGVHLHCDFRRVRVAAESLFAASVVMDEFTAPVAGTIRYFVPPTSMLSADPQFLFFRDVDPSLVPVQPIATASRQLVVKAAAAGVIRTLWPQADPIVTETWLATRVNTPAIASIPLRFAGPVDSGAGIRARATARVPSILPVPVSGVGRTVAKTVSAKLAKLTTDVMSARSIGWTAKFLAAAELLHCTDKVAVRIEVIEALATMLNGDISRTLERGLSDHEMRTLYDSLPARLRGATKVRSSTTVVYAVLYDVSAATDAHTVLRAARRTIQKGRELATSATVSTTMFDPASARTVWLDEKLHTLREFWASIYAALPATRAAWKFFPSDVRWWLDVAASVNQFRASVMRCITMTRDGRTRTRHLEVVGEQLYFAPYPAAAALRKELSASLAIEIPSFGRGDSVSDWLAAALTRVIPEIQAKHIPRRLADASTALHSRALSLINGYATQDLAEWMEQTFHDVAEDLGSLHSAVMRARSARSVRLPAVASTVVAVESVLATLAAVGTVEEIAAQVSSSYSVLANRVEEDAWDEFCMALVDPSHPYYEAAKTVDARAKNGMDEAEIAETAAWISGTFADEVEEEDTGATIY